MLILIVGPPKAGKSLLAAHLCSRHSFTRVHLSQASPSPDALQFSSSSSFLDYATATWRENYVCTDLRSATKLSEFSKRPWCIILAVDGPVGVRFSRAVADAKAEGSVPPTLEDFVAADDLAHHGPLPLSLLTNGTASLSLTEDDDEPTQSLSTPRKQQQHLATTTEGRSPVPSPARSPNLTRDDPFTASPIPSSSPAEPLSTLLPLASLTLSNPYSDPSAFLSTLPSLSQLSDLLRPQWDTYFMLLACLASLRSNCMKRRVGAVLVREKRVVSTGYNGTPRGVRNCGEGGCGRCNSGGDGWHRPSNPAASWVTPSFTSAPSSAIASSVPSNHQPAQRPPPTSTAAQTHAMGQNLEECLCLHAEENALIEAGRERVSGGSSGSGGVEGAVLYCNTCPCLRCTIKIVQAGVSCVVYSLSYSMDTASRRVLEEAGVGLRQMRLPDWPRG